MKSTGEEEILADQLRKRGFRVERFNKGEKEKSKTPDFRIYKDLSLAFFCEVKSVVEDDWILREFSNPETLWVGKYRGGTIHNRIVRKIHEAFLQFETVNKEHTFSNILAFVNWDRSTRPEYLIQVLTGDHFADNGKRNEGVFGKYSNGQIKDEKTKIDGFFWFERTNPGRSHKMFLFVWSDSRHYLALKEAFSLPRRRGDQKPSLLPYSMRVL